MVRDKKEKREGHAEIKGSWFGKWLSDITCHPVRVRGLVSGTRLWLASSSVCHFVLLGLW